MFHKPKNGVKMCVYYFFIAFVHSCRYVDPKIALNFFTDFCCFLHSMQLSPVFSVNELSKQTTTRCYGSCCDSQGDLRYRPLTIF